MALKFGPQWLRDLSDSGAGTNPNQPHSPTVGNTKFKLADYRYGREEMLSLWNHNSPPPDQVRKHLPIFSKEIQKPITMMPLTEDEQRLISQGFNSTGVLRAAGRGPAPTLRTARGGGTVDRGRGRGRGRGEGYAPRSENGDVGYHRTPQDGWEQVGRKLERSYSRGYEEGGASSGNVRREYSRSASDNNWRDKKQQEEEEDQDDQPREGGWRAPQSRDTRWGPQTRRDWRDPPRDLSGFEGDRRPPPQRRGYDSDMRGPRRTSESHDNEGEVPEWVEDDAGDDPGTFDSSGAFVSTRERRKVHGGLGNQDGCDSGGGNNGRKYVPPNARNGSGGHAGGSGSDMGGQGENGDVQAARKDSANGLNQKGEEDCGFAFPHSEDIDGASAPPGQYIHSPGPTSQQHAGEQQQHTHVTNSSPSPPAADIPQQPAPLPTQQQEEITGAGGGETGVSGRPPATQHVDPAFAHVEKSLQNLVAQMTLDAEKDGQPRDVSREALPLTHEHANKWFYKDPQGEIQGPFANEEMAQWFGAGYFTMSLVVKRGCDDSFKQLGELIKRYGRVPFLPGTPLPPLISSVTPDPTPVSATQPFVNPVSTSTLGIPQQSMPSMVNPAAMPSLVSPDPLLQQMMLLQQEYLKQTYLMRQMQVQTLQQLQQDQENFASLPPEQQQHLSMQLMMQTNPMLMQQLQHIQQQQLLLQQQLQHQQQQQQQQLTRVTQSEENKNFPAMHPSMGGLAPSPASTPSSTPSSVAALFSAAAAASAKQEETDSVWATRQQQQPQPPANVWSHRASQASQQQQQQQNQQPASLWDIDPATESAYKAQVEKIKKAREEDRLREEERLRQEHLERKQEELRRQQEELERQKEQVRREKEELERQKQLDLHKREEARRREEEASRLEDKRIQREIEKQQQEQRDAEKRRQEEQKKRQEEDRKREKETKKQEEKRRKEEEKRRMQEEQKRQEELRRKQAQEAEEERLRELQRAEERRLQSEMKQQEREEEERIQREAAERERAEREKAEAQKRQAELQRQNESLRRLQQAQREQLANMQLPAHSNWANQQQSSQSGPTQSRSLTEIQQEEARRENERLLRQQQGMAKMQEQATLMNIQNQQKSWATHASHGTSSRGPSLLDIQQQEQENMRKNQKDKPKTTTYQSKLSSLVSGASWASGPPSSGWPSNATSSVWGDTTSTSIWDQPAATPPQPRRGQQQAKESGEFPALKNPSQQNKKAAAKANAKKGATSKQKKEEETVQKLFQTRQQDSFTQWVSDRVSRFSAHIDVPTFVSFIVEVDSPDDVRDYITSYLGDSKESRDFAKQFVDKRNRSRNQARLEKQQEEDSIWGPAPAVNPHIQARVTNNSAGAGGDTGDNGAGAGGKAGKNKRKKQKMQKLEASSILGFTVHSDPNRKNAAGELESVQ